MTTTTADETGHPDRPPASDPALEFLTALLPANKTVRTRAFDALLRALTAPAPQA